MLVALPLSFLQRRFTPRTVFMEVGGLDCTLALRAAGYVERVYAVVVAGQLLQSFPAPCNLRLVRCDGVRIPAPESAVHLAWGGAFIERLQSDDAREHLASVRRILVPGGEYICTTDSPRELGRRLREAGFSKVRFYAGIVRVPRAALGLVPAGRLRVCAIK